MGRIPARWLALAMLPALASPGIAQGPPPAGIRDRPAAPVVWQMPVPRQDSTASRRVPGPLIGAALGGVLGVYLGSRAARDPGPGDGDGLGSTAYIITIPLGVGLGALLGHILDEPR